MARRDAALSFYAARESAWRVRDCNFPSRTRGRRARARARRFPFFPLPARRFRPNASPLFFFFFLSAGVRRKYARVFAPTMNRGGILARRTAPAREPYYDELFLFGFSEIAPGARLHCNVSVFPSRAREALDYGRKERAAPRGWARYAISRSRFRSRRDPETSGRREVSLSHRESLGATVVAAKSRKINRAFRPAIPGNICLSSGHFARFPI